MKQESKGNLPCHFHLYTLLEPMQSHLRYYRLTNWVVHLHVLVYFGSP